MKTSIISRVLADDIDPMEASFIISKLKSDAEKHGYSIRGTGEAYFTFWGENNCLSKISYDSGSQQITETQLKEVKRIWLDYAQ
ncbi:hypothetical protein Ami103574_04180 [Aminipila butyrica]|uniref:Uncharacterized protein n=1 Tax=Aminipila butyrica TaxID=433296 RepID=A0A858BU17_9FIRM|nr:hypothetical protein [Aminipila butyrica]QIB68568.1 hypothetical protein Ami103574_04180 [Aminipila butyrica]